MTSPYVAGAAPVSFVSEDVGGNAGKQYSIPLAALSVNASNQPDATAWLAAMGSGLSAGDQALVTALVASLTAQGFLTVATAP